MAYEGDTTQWRVSCNSGSVGTHKTLQSAMDDARRWLKIMETRHGAFGWVAVDEIRTRRLCRLGNDGSPEARKAAIAAERMRNLADFKAMSGADQDDE